MWRMFLSENAAMLNGFVPRSCGFSKRQTPTAIKHEHDLPRHVKRSQKGGKHAEIKRNVRHAPTVRRMQNGVLAPETGEHQRKAAEREHTDRIGRKRYRHEFAQLTHAAYVLFVMASVNYRARAEKQQRLEKRVGDEMEHANRHTAYSQTQHHEAQLRNGGVSENAFDISLRHGNCRAK